MNCEKCGLEKPIVNKYFKLCRGCNNKRLHGNEYGKQYEYTFGGRSSGRTAAQQRLIERDDWKVNKKRKQKRKSISAPEESKKENNFHKDEELYEKVFNTSDHKCEECNTQLNEQFRDDFNLTILCRWRYSHIIPKSIAPKLRHKIENINNLCLTCHQKWENGDKKSMRIYKENVKRFPNYF